MPPAAAGPDRAGDATPAHELIRERIAQLARGDVELLDADDVVADLERRYAWVLHRRLNDVTTPEERP